MLIIYVVMQCLNFFQQVDSTGIEFDLSKYTSNSSKGCVPKVDLENLKEFNKLRNDYSLALDKVEIKRGMLPEYQPKTADLYNICIGDVKNLVLNFFDKDQSVLHYENL